MTALKYFQAKLDATISPHAVSERAAARPESLLFVDVRTGPTPTKIPGAVAIPQPEIVARMGDLPKDKLLILYSWDTWCSLAAKAAVTLLQAGFFVKVLDGGIAAWESLRLPTESAESLESLRRHHHRWARTSRYGLC
jgi:rhodanese-related sulfurtransferase